MARWVVLVAAAALLFGAVQSAIPRSECSTYEAPVPVRRSGEPIPLDTLFRLQPPGATPGPVTPSPEMTMGTRTTCTPVKANTTLAVILSAFGLASIWYSTKV